MQVTEASKKWDGETCIPAQANHDIFLQILTSIFI
jgi:hypothetical protein